MVPDAEDAAGKQQQPAGKETAAGAKLVMDRVSYVVNKGKSTILDKVSVSVASGELVAVMGASGSGKTTLEMLMTGVAAPSEGRVLINHEVVDAQALRRSVIYVPQDDLLLHTMTTEEALLESVRFNNVKGATNKENRDVVETILKKFNLHACRNVRVGSPDTKKGLSGGQRKRLSIALEMIAEKSFLVLDEPTSGLDSSSASSVVSLLRAAADTGTGVLATIHSPSADLFFSFDKVLLLVQGRMAYFGPTRSMMSFFNAAGFTCPEFTNPADWAISLLTVNEEFDTAKDEERVKVIVDAAESIEVLHGKGYRAPPAMGSKDSSVKPSSQGDLEVGEGSLEAGESDRVAVSEMSAYGELVAHPMLPLMAQIGVLLKRNFRHMRREPALGRARMGSHTLLGVIIGILFYEIGADPSSVPDRIALNLFCVVFLMLSCALPTVITFLPERAVFIKEHRNRRYSAGAFYLSKALADLPLQLIPATIFFTIVYFMAGYGEDGGSVGTRYGSMLLSLLAFVLTVHAWATFISCVAPSLSVAVFMVPMSFMPMMLLMGFFKPVDDISWILRWASYFPNFFSPVWRMINIAGFIDFDFSVGQSAGYVSGDQVLEDRLLIESSWAEYWRSFGVLLAYLVFIRVVAFVALVKLHAK